MDLFRTAAKVMGSRSMPEEDARELQRKKEVVARQIRTLAKHKSSYAKKAELVFEKQKNELNLLKREQENYEAELHVMKKKAREDQRDVEVLEEMIQKVDDAEQKRRDIQVEVVDLKTMIRHTEREITKLQNMRRVLRNAEQRGKRTLPLMHVERQTEVETQKYDTVVEEIRKYRDDVHHLHVTREQLTKHCEELEADIKRLTYSLHKEIRYASDNLDNCMNTRRNYNILAELLEKRRDAFETDVQKIDRTVAQERWEREFVVVKNKPLHDMSEDRRREKMSEQAAANKRIIADYIKHLNTLREAFKDVLDQEATAKEEKESTSKATPKQKNEEGETIEIADEENEQDEDTAAVREMEMGDDSVEAAEAEVEVDAGRSMESAEIDGKENSGVEEVRVKTAADVIREKLGENGLETVLHSFLSLAWENNKLYWQVYYKADLSHELRAEKDDVRDQIVGIHTRLARAEEIARLKRKQLTASIQAHKDMAMKVEAEIEKCDEVIQSYAVPLLDLMTKMGITAEETQKLIKPWDKINQMNILRCFGACERVVDDLHHQQTVHEFLEFSELHAEHDDHSNEFQPDRLPNRMEVVERYAVVPPGLPDAEDQELSDVDESGMLESQDDVTGIPLPEEWEDRPLSKDELLEHLSRHMLEEYAGPDVVVLNNPPADLYDNSEDLE